eukprot:GHVT01063575.1.p1 GENE.GHVT01063575.1~~GHVT01063575.1.p1  ORF type:complete len:125 (+),score=32.95 GHVT01063575.1:591-965(+)
MMTTVIERDEEFSSRMPTVRIESPPSPTEFDDQGIAGADQEEVPVASAAPTPMEETAEDLPDASNVATAGLTMEAPPRRSLGLFGRKKQDFRDGRARTAVFKEAAADDDKVVQLLKVSHPDNIT